MKPISKKDIIKKQSKKSNNEKQLQESQKVILLSVNYSINNRYNNKGYFERNKNTFNKFAHNQWNNLKVYKNQYLMLFDKLHGCSLYHVISVNFDGMIINNKTNFIFSNNITNNFIKKNIQSPDIKKLNNLTNIIIEIIGYVNFNNYIEEEDFFIDDINLFKEYIREQLKNTKIKKDQYFFDNNLFKGLSYKVISIDPNNSDYIDQNTNITIIQKNNDIKKLTKIKKANNKLFEEIIGQENAKKKCLLIEKYLSNPKFFGKWAPKNILFYGPSGTGKTMMARALAHKIQVPFLSIKATRLIGEFVGEGSKQIHELYDKAEEISPCIIFIDEIDAIALDRKYQDLRGDVVEIVNALISEMDGISERIGICTIASTNRIESLDSSVRSRFEEEIEFILPSEKEIQQLIKNNINSFPIKPDIDFNINNLASYLNGLSCRDIIEKILKKTLHEAIIENYKKIPFELFKKSIENIKKSKVDINRLYI